MTITVPVGTGIVFVGTATVGVFEGTPGVELPDGMMVCVALASRVGVRVAVAVAV